jgi:hypothetical protein
LVPPRRLQHSKPDLIAIPDIGLATSYPSTIEVTDFDPGRTVTDINTTLHNFIHESSDDINILLVDLHDQNVAGRRGGCC